MNEYIKYFDDVGKNMSFKIKDESVYQIIMKFGTNLKRH